MQNKGSVVEASPQACITAAGPSVLWGSSDNMMQGNEFNNVTTRDMSKSNIVVNINNVAAPPSHEGSLSGRRKRSVQSLTPCDDETNVPTTGLLGTRTLRRILGAFSYASQEGKVVEMDGSDSVGDDKPWGHDGTSNLCPGDRPRPNVDLTDLSCLEPSVASRLCRTLRDSVNHAPASDPTMSASEMYSRVMLFHKLGYPLYMPEPDQGRSKEYRRKGIRIGDVGRITPAGAFDFLFNTCLPADHPINPQVLPKGFEVLQPVDVTINRNFEADTLLLSEHIEQTSQTPITYRCSGTEGAVLALPEGSVLFEAQNTSTFQRHAARHAESWYEYMTGYKGRNALNGSLYLVTGCVKSKNWGIAAFYKGKTDENSLQLTFHEEVTNSGHKMRSQYRWEKSGRVIARMGPSFSDIEVEGNAELNQCTFICGYKIMLREDIWEGLTNIISVPSSQGEPSEPSPSQPRHKRRRVEEASEEGPVATGASQNDRGDVRRGGACRSSWSSDKNVERVMVEGDFTTVSPAHPSDCINTMLLQLDRKAKVALTHDREWYDALPNHFSLDPSSLKVDELLENVAKIYFGVVDEFDGISLVNRNDIKQHTNSQATHFGIPYANQGAKSPVGNGPESAEKGSKEDAIIDVRQEDNVGDVGNVRPLHDWLRVLHPRVKGGNDIKQESDSEGKFFDITCNCQGCRFPLANGTEERCEEDGMVDAKQEGYTDEPDETSLAKPATRFSIPSSVGGGDDLWIAYFTSLLDSNDGGINGGRGTGDDGGSNSNGGGSPQPVPPRDGSFPAQSHSQFTSAVREGRVFPSIYEDDECELPSDMGSDEWYVRQLSRGHTAFGSAGARSHVFHQYGSGSLGGSSSSSPYFGSVGSSSSSSSPYFGSLGGSSTTSGSSLSRSSVLTDEEAADYLGLLNINPNELPPTSSSKYSPSQPSSPSIFGSSHLRSSVFARDTSHPFLGFGLGTPGTGGTNGGGNSYLTAASLRRQRQQLITSTDDYPGISDGHRLRTLGIEYGTSQQQKPQQPSYYVHQRRVSEMHGMTSPTSAGATSSTGVVSQGAPPSSPGSALSRVPPYSPNLSDLGKGTPLHSVPSSYPLFTVEFKAGRTDLYYCPDPKLEVHVGDLVIVEADRGRDLGKVVKEGITVREVEVWQQAKRAQTQTYAVEKEINPKAIYGKAGPQETQMLASKTQDEQKALQMCQSKVRVKKLAMEVVDAEYQWDRRKLTFYFVAEKRIDFRELVRELFRLYKTRIHMTSLPEPGGYGQ